MPLEVLSSDRSLTTILQSYRPISLTSVLSKLLERFIVFLQSTDFFSSQPQFAYLKGLDTTQALLYMTLHIQEGFKTGKVTAAALLDMEGAFDSVWRKGVIYKLIKLGLRGRLLLIIEDFFSNRLTRSMVNTFITEWTSTDVGVPQGSILAVILFLVFFGDISDNLRLHVKFADDLSLWNTNTSASRAAEELTQDLKAVSNWAHLWRMGVSTAKSHVMCFCKHGHTQIKVEYNNQVLTQVKEQRALGVILDENLSFKAHTLHTTSKARSTQHKLGAFTRQVGGASAEANIFLYKACVLPDIEYCYPVWCSTTSIS